LTGFIIITTLFKKNFDVSKIRSLNIVETFLANLSQKFKADLSGKRE